MEPVEGLRQRALDFTFRGGTLYVPEHQRFLSHEAANCAIEGDRLHPMWVMVGGLRSMGVTIADLIELMGSTLDDGVVFGEATIEQSTGLRAGHEHEVTARCTDVERRSGRRAGVFDVLTFEIDLARSGSHVARSTNAFIFPRAEVQDVDR